MHSEPVNEHLSQLHPFLTHFLVVQDPVGTYNIEVFYFSLDQQIAALGVYPKFIALHNYLLVVCFGELLLKSKWIQCKCVMKRHFILNKTMLVAFILIIVYWPRHFLWIDCHGHCGHTIKLLAQ
jgi:hypothetical protein